MLNRLLSRKFSTQNSNEQLIQMYKSFINKLPKHRILFGINNSRFAHPIYDLQNIEEIPITHVPATNIRAKFAHGIAYSQRKLFDLITNYDKNNMTDQKYLNRAIVLETVAAVPGMIGGMIRHMRSLRTLQRDNGWIHHLLEEAENERMHLFIFLHLKKPNLLLKLMIFLGQGFMFSFYFLMYIISPKMAHRYVGYLEEEAVKTYTQMIKDYDNDKLPLFKNSQVPEDVREYYNLKQNCTFRDVLLSIRADEKMHSEYNHYFADIDQKQQVMSYVSDVNQKVEDQLARQKQQPEYQLKQQDQQFGKLQY